MMGFQMQFPYSEHANSVASSNLTSSYGGGSSGQQTHALSSTSDIGEVSLKSQKSIYSLTLEEFQSTLGEPGKSFGSMNMEELLKNIWTAEEGQAVAAAIGAIDVPGPGISKQVSLPRQGSLSIREPIGRKTVDEIWKNMYQDSNELVGSTQLPPKRRELTFGEVTLEDFLVKAGIVSEKNAERNTSFDGFAALSGSQAIEKSNGNQFRTTHGDLSNSRMLPSTSNIFSNTLTGPHQALQVDSTSVSLQSMGMYGDSYMKAVPPHSQLFGRSPTGAVGDTLPQATSVKQSSSVGYNHAPTGLGGLGSPIGGGIAASLSPGANYNGFNNILSLAVPNYKMDSPLSQSSDGMGTSQGNAPLSPVLAAATTPRKRLGEGSVEMVVERRQRRMLKNRESAARSRARKQAYTMELENELKELRAENLKLKQKQEAAETHMKKVISVTQEAAKEKATLRRTRTGPW